MSLEIGSAKVDITPESAVPLSGYALRGNKPYEDIQSRLYLRALYVRERKEGGTVSSAVIVSADLLWWGSDRVPHIREKLFERWGLEPAAIVLNGTHSHSGPQTSFMFHRLLGQADAAYVEYLENKLLEAIELAENNAEPVSIERGAAQSDIGIQRRHYANGQVTGGYNPAGPNDPEVTVIRFRSKTGATKAVVVHYACHPVTTNMNRVSSEFTGAAMELLEERLASDAVCLFLQGACGDINVFKSSAPEDLTNDYAIIDYFGKRLADTVSGVLNGTMERVGEPMLKWSSHSLRLPLNRLPGKAELEAIAAKGESPYDEWAATMLSKHDERPDHLVLEMNRLDVAEGLSLLAMNAEVVVEYGLFVKEISGGRVLPVPYSNGMIGYVPTKKQIEHGGYEPVFSTYYFHMPSTFPDSIEGTIREQIGRIACE